MRPLNAAVRVKPSPFARRENGNRIMQIKVCLIEPGSRPASQLVEWIAGAGDMICAGAFSTVEAALAELPRTLPDVVLVDLRYPELNGVELIRKLKTACPALQCLVITTFGESAVGLDVLRAGASGCLAEPVQTAEFVEAIRQVHAGGSVIAPRVARRLLELFTHPPEVAAEDRLLDDRERKVLQYLAEGRPRKDIANALGTNTHKLDYIIRGIYRKLHVNCAAAAVSAALKMGISK
jgi:DNA-binding NarL/FixJ family response regulator